MFEENGVGFIWFIFMCDCVLLLYVIIIVIGLFICRFKFGKVIDIESIIIRYLLEVIDNFGWWVSEKKDGILCCLFFMVCWIS